MLQLRLLDDGCPWAEVTRDFAPARELADRHYSRQTPGAKDFMGPGRTFVLYAADASGAAVWGCIDHLNPAGDRTFRCTIFRNETGILSSELVRAATRLTQAAWRQRSGWAGEPPLTTEVDPEKTRRKRDPGRCFRRAGWVEVDRRRGLVHLRAPEPAWAWNPQP